MTSKDKFLFLLNSLCFDRPRLMHLMAETFSSAENLQRGYQQLLSQNRYKEKFQAEIRARLEAFDIETIQTAMQKHHISALRMDDPGYPTLLKEISYPPLLLYYRGNPDYFKPISLAIVGTRNPSEYGIKATKALCQQLCRHFLITSGMALGIDTVAHETTLEQNEPTIAVLGNGLDRCYPSRNQALGRKIIETGLLVSEFPPGTPSAPQHFPQRNRIISGLVRGVLVIEAKEKSGALITARLAMESNREVFALPGSMFSERSDGCHNLLRDGATLVTNADTIIDTFSHLAEAKSRPRPLHAPPTPQVPPSLSDPETEIWNILPEDGLHIDTIVEKSTLNIQGVLTTLSMLELKQHIKQSPGKVFSRC